MLYKIAIIPEIFSSDDNFQTLERELDLLWDYIFDNCLIMLPKDNLWIDYISASKMPLRLREKTFGYIRRIKNANRIITTSTKVNDGDWYKWGMNAYKEYGLYAVVAPARRSFLNDGGDKVVINFPISPSQDLLVNLKKSKCKIVLTKEEDFEKTIKPVLEYARILRVIDPYVNTKDWSRNSIEIASKLLGCSLKKKKKYTCKFEIYISEGKAALAGLKKNQTREAGELKKVWEPIWEKIKSYENSLKVVVFGNEINQKELHDRFILTDQCGIMLSTGFSCDQPAHSQVWIMLPENTYKAVADMFITAPPYPLRSQIQFLPY